jgi:hypothetical protein
MILISFSIMAFIACNKDTTILNQKSADYFPNKVGNYWIYEVNDTSQINYHQGYPRTYDVKVSIISEKVMVDGNYATVWTYQFPWGVDTNFIRLVGDTIKVYDTSYSSNIRDLEFPRKLFILPFINGASWKGKLLWIDTFNVSKNYNLSNGFLNFDSSFNIYHYYYGSQDLRQYDNYWFEPNIGFVKIYYKHFYGAPWEYYTWNLKNYYLK